MEQGHKVWDKVGEQRESFNQEMESLIIQEKDWVKRQSTVINNAS